MTIWASSDLHINYPQNWDWWRQLSAEAYQNDWLILAGDVHHELEPTLTLLRSLVPKFERVFFVPGNHDLWLQPNDPARSMLKFEQLLACLHTEGVYTQPYLTDTVGIVPLFSWYDYSFGQPSRTLRRAWQDYQHCKWERNMAELTQYFLSLQPPPEHIPSKTIISFSHFMPRRDLLPAKGPKIVEMLLPVLGSNAIDVQARAWGSQYHIYGHHHLNRSVHIDGVFYCNNAFGYPQEEDICRRTLLPVYRQGLIIHEQYPPLPPY